MIATQSPARRSSTTPKSAYKQGSLTNFIKFSPLARTSAQQSAPEGESDTDSDEGTPKTKTKAKSKSTIDGGTTVKGPMDMQHLPPINDLNEMFADLIENEALGGLEALLDKLEGRKLRVATMCSGTESPLLALSLIAPIVQQKYGKSLEIEHVFSCEIEPFKQAYIERNFSPPILFRDVCELGNDEAMTAYGAKVKVPGNVDILIAGTSCVDFSNLNNNKQTIDQEGESGATFQGMINWVDRHRPTIVLIENVLSAPWEKSVCPKFRRIGYAAEWIKLDTKRYYIPHTRQRGYMCAVDARANKGKGKDTSKKVALNGQGKFKTGDFFSIPAQWKDLVKKLERPASSPIEAFLLPEDDPRIVRTRASFQDVISKRSTVDWARCEVRHRDARFAEEIGEKRPLTLWTEGGGCSLPDFAWNDWAVTQPERVLDLMDISILRYAVKGVDASYKTIVWNLSQNVDRIGYPKGGLSPCMTPTMIPYISNRGGPMTGYEALGMQGLPVDRLLLTRESEDNCMDLAGNAMSTTVVGSCIMAALVLAVDQIKKHREAETTDEEMHIDAAKHYPSEFVGQDRLLEKKIDLASVTPVEIATLLTNASRARRLCDCEGRTSQTSRKIVQCQDCAVTACSKCQGRPEHKYPRLANGEIDFDAFVLDRLDPKEFEQQLKEAIPMRLTFQDIAGQAIEELTEKRQKYNIPVAKWKAWKAGCLKALSSELRFRTLKRQSVWSATWDSESAMLELILDSRQPEWRLFAKADPSLEASSEIRALFNQPFARLALDTRANSTLLDGTWDLCLPSVKTVDIEFRGGDVGTGEDANGLDDHGDLVPSWEMSLGLLADEFRTKRVWKYLDVKISEDGNDVLDQSIDGRYHLIDRCGCANNSLHKLEGQHMYLFLDPKRCTGAEADSFVFSVSQRRYIYGESRPIAATLNPKWRQFGQAQAKSKVVEKLSSTCTIEGVWLPFAAMSIEASSRQEAIVQLPTESRSFSPSVDLKACAAADAILVCKLPLTDAEKIWTKEWTEVDHIHQRQTFGAVSWLTERLRGIEGLSSWMSLETYKSADLELNCERCAPSPPEVFFGEVLYRPKSKGAKCTTRIQGVEDIGEAGRFEQGLKNRPVPFATQLRLVNNIAEFRIGINVASMVHQALSRLPKGPNPAEFAWRLDTKYVEKQRLVLPSFKRALEQNSNRNEEEAKQPPHFKIPLRKEQLRSLTWMLRQESSAAEPWIEQEVIEALLPPLNWRAEARASRRIEVYGGVLADEVGYGKTAITLGLIDSSPQRPITPPDEYGLISTKASLIIVPGHLIKQWPSEINKFLGKDVKVISIENIGHLKKYKIKDFLEADIICVSGTILKNKNYLGQLGALAGGVNIPDKSDKGGRYFDQKHSEAMKGLAKTVEDLKANHASKVWHDVKEGRAEELESRKAVFIQKKRMKGRAFREQKAEQRLAALAKGVLPDSDIPKVKPDSASSKPGRKPSTTKLLTSKANLPPTRPKPRKKRRIILESSEEELDICVSPDIDSDNCSDTSGEIFMPNSPHKRANFEIVIRRPPKTKVKATIDTGFFKTAKTAASSDTSTTKTLSTDDSEDIAMCDIDEPQEDEQVVEIDLVDTKALDEDDMDEEGNLIDLSADLTTDLKADRGVEVNNAIKMDPWNLADSAVYRDYKQMYSPVFEMFKFNRFVIDEYTYLKDKLHKMTMQMRSDRRWILSGTPPLEDFAAIKTISVFLGVDLGIKDIPPSLKGQKNWFNEFTAVEKFHSFRETKSFAWHVERHRQAERFLKQFMRQNKPEINEIPSTQQIHNIVLPAAERAIYLELLHHLQALDMNIRKSKKGASDRDRRITESFGESQTAEEALLKRCAHFDYSAVHDQEDNAIYECDRLVETRTRQLRECENQLHDTLWELFKEEDADSKANSDSSVQLFNKESIFRTWLMHMHTNGTTDGDATARIRRMINACTDAINTSGKTKPVLAEYDTDAARRQKLRYNKKKSHILNKPESMEPFLPPGQRKKLRTGQKLATMAEDVSDEGIDEDAASAEAADTQSSSEDDQPIYKKKRTTKAKIISSLDSDNEGGDNGAQEKLISKQPDWVDVKRGLFKDKSHMLKRIEKELVGRVKSLRFFEVVRDVQRLNSTTIAASDKPQLTFICPGPNCKHRDINGNKIALALKDVCVFSTCGHSGCYECLREFAADQKCPQPQCLSPGILNVIVKSTSLGEEEDIKNEQVAGKHWGTKIEQICDLILNKIPKDEKIILFCQFKDLTETVDDALHDKGVDRIRITGSSSAKSKALGRFQDPRASERVLVLQADDESASGANLTVANHVIFVSPLIAETAGQYQAQETQAIGRVKRFGQKRHVYVHRFLTTDTIDTEIYEQREREKELAERDEPEEY